MHWKMPLTWSFLLKNYFFFHFKYIKKIFKPNGLIGIQDKKELRKLHNESPDFADCTMMALYAINYCLSSVVHSYSSFDCYVNSEFEPFD